MAKTIEHDYPSVTVRSFLLHLTTFLWQLYGMYKYHGAINLPMFINFGGRLKFLTHLTACVVLLSTGIATLVDFVHLVIGSSKRSFMIVIRDELMSFWCYTTGSFVPIMYWGIVMADPHGIHPPVIEKLMPMRGWHNNFLHTAPFFFANICILFVNYEHAGVKRALVNAILLGTGYTAWMYKCKTMNGNWPYPFLDKFTMKQLTVFILCSNVLFFIMALIGRKIASLKWKVPSHEISKNK